MSSDTEAVFTRIYQKNSWGDADSVSGTGSNLKQTEALRRGLRQILKIYKINSVLDIACGDFYWMSQLDLSGLQYTGVDIVADIIAKNQAKYRQPNLTFQQLNLITDNLPKSDLILCRDCLVHLPYKDIVAALENVRRSQSTYFLATTFTDRGANTDAVTGQWRPINLQKPPFNLPEPIFVLNEGCTENGGQFADKSLGLWRGHVGL